MSDADKHYLEVGESEVPRRKVLDEALPPGEPQKPADAVPIAPSAGGAEMSAAENRGVEAGFDSTKTYVAIDYRGDRPESEWQSFGERLAGRFWHIVIFVAIIAVVILRWSGCV